MQHCFVFQSLHNLWSVCALYATDSLRTVSSLEISPCVHKIPWIRPDLMWWECGQTTRSVTHNITSPHSSGAFYFSLAHLLLSYQLVTVSCHLVYVCLLVHYAQPFLFCFRINLSSCFFHYLTSYHSHQCLPLSRSVESFREMLEQMVDDERRWNDNISNGPSPPGSQSWVLW